MKRIITVFFSCMFICSFQLMAQESYLGFRLGTSIPKGDFAASENLFNNGYAIPGFTVSFEGFYYPLPVVGVGGVLGFGSLFAERDVYLEDLIQYAYSQSTIPVFGSPPSTDEVGFESGFWNYVNLLAGPELSIPFGPFQAGVRGLGGLTMAFYPTRELLYAEGGNSLETMTKGPSVAISYSYGASLLYRSRSGTGLKLNADYMNSSASYDFEMDVVNEIDEYKLTRTENVDMQALSLTLGFFYVF